MKTNLLLSWWTEIIFKKVINERWKRIGRFIRMFICIISTLIFLYSCTYRREEVIGKWLYSSISDNYLYIYENINFTSTNFSSFTSRNYFFEKLKILEKKL